ncbi:MAG: diphthine--ammonia ligase [Anaerovoracaceae bacterium]
MKFIMSFSGGKDSNFALYKMIKEGHDPMGLLVMVNKEREESWFHGVDLEFLEAISKSMDIPLLLVKSEGEDYHLAMEETLREQKALGALGVCFGDIDIKQHREWCTQRAENAGLSPFFPLWQHDREENTYAIVDAGFKCIVKTLHNDKLPVELLGKPMDRPMIDVFKQCGIDVCGEDGEYHTVVVDGPIFNKPVKYTAGEVTTRGHISSINIKLIK